MTTVEDLFKPIQPASLRQITSNAYVDQACCQWSRGDPIDQVMASLHYLRELPLTMAMPIFEAIIKRSPRLAMDVALWHTAHPDFKLRYRIYLHLLSLLPDFERIRHLFARLDKTGNGTYDPHAPAMEIVPGFIQSLPSLVKRMESFLIEHSRPPVNTADEAASIKEELRKAINEIYDERLSTIARTVDMDALDKVYKFLHVLHSPHRELLFQFHPDEKVFSMDTHIPGRDHLNPVPANAIVTLAISISSWLADRNPTEPRNEDEISTAMAWVYRSPVLVVPPTTNLVHDDPTESSENDAINVENDVYKESNVSVSTGGPVGRQLIHLHGHARVPPLEIVRLRRPDDDDTYPVKHFRFEHIRPLSFIPDWMYDPEMFTSLQIVPMSTYTSSLIRMASHVDTLTIIRPDVSQERTMQSIVLGQYRELYILDGLKNGLLKELILRRYMIPCRTLSLVPKSVRKLCLVRSISVCDCDADTENRFVYSHPKIKHPMKFALPVTDLELGVMTRDQITTLSILRHFPRLQTLILHHGLTERNGVVVPHNSQTAVILRWFLRYAGNPNRRKQLKTLDLSNLMSVRYEDVFKLMDRDLHLETIRFKSTDSMREIQARQAVVLPNATLTILCVTDSGTVNYEDMMHSDDEFIDDDDIIYELKQTKGQGTKRPREEELLLRRR